MRHAGELDKWGYRDADWDQYCDFDVSLPIKDALKGLGVDDKMGVEEAHNKCMECDHEAEATIDGTTYHPTGARFTTIFNAEDGVIVAWSSYGAKYEAARQNPPVTVLPKLQNWSDIAWLQWINNAGDKVKNLRYVFRSPAFNTDAEWLITRAWGNAGKQLPFETWPGVEFSMDTDEGKAILSSPNGAGVAYLLFTHKR
jgi:hypothetical protein